jgi:hypothetical protein
MDSSGISLNSIKFLFIYESTVFYFIIQNIIDIKKIIIGKINLKVNKSNKNDLSVLHS